MSGLKLVIPTSFTDLTLPVLRDDPLLTAGSIALIEPAHPASPFAGVPVNGSIIPNIAHAEAAATLGVTDANFGAVFAALGGIASGTKGKIERTPKGGLHIIVSQAPGVLSGDGAKLDLSAQVRSWLYTKAPTREFFISVWDRPTRAALGGTPGGVVHEFGNAANSNMLIRYTASGGWSQNTTPVPGANARFGASNTLGNRIANVKTTAGNSNLSASPNNAGPQWGTIAGTYSDAVAGWKTQMPSSVFYRLYVEDLTASGRSYAQVDALDFAEYTKQVLTAGGRYYGDTIPTDPATIP